MKRLMTGIVTTVGIASVGLAQSGAPSAPPKTWADNVTVKGDIRYRYESIEDDSKLNADKETFARERNRIRARAGIEGKCNDRLKAGIEFSTGQADPVSGNQTIGDGFGKKEFRLNLAYAEFGCLHPDSPHAVKIVGGKMKNPFINVADLIWDGDATPEGLAAQGQFASRFVDAMANAGYLWVQERSTDNDDTLLYAGQGAVKVKFTPEVSLLLGASLYQYDNMEGYDVIDWERANNGYGNSTKAGSISKSAGVTTTNKAWKTDFIPMEYFAALEVWVGGRPLTLLGQVLSNSEADDFEKGHQVGVTYGRAKNPKTFEVGYWYAELEKDAVPGFLTDSDRWGGGTDGRGHKFAAKYQVMKNLQLGATYFMGERKISLEEDGKDSTDPTDYNRLQVDVVAAF
jgi:hypothetical protein